MERLADGDIEFFFPTSNLVKQSRRRKTTVNHPLFPSYIFIHLKDVQQYFFGAGIDGVVRYVRFGSEFARVDGRFISSLKLLVKAKQEIEVSAEYFEAGRKFIISEGPLQGLECELVQYSGGEKMLIRVHLLMRSLLINVEKSRLVPV